MTLSRTLSEQSRNFLLRDQFMTHKRVRLVFITKFVGHSCYVLVYINMYYAGKQERRMAGRCRVFGKK